MLFLLTSEFLPDLPLDPQEPFKWHIIFLSSAVFWLLSGILKGPNGFLAFLVPRLEPKKLEINLGNTPKVLRKAPYQLAAFLA